MNYCLTVAKWSLKPATKDIFREVKSMRKVLGISVLTAACTLIGVSGSLAQDYYRQEQDRKREYYDRQDLRRDYRERAQDERRFRWDRYKERQAERRGDWRAADY